MRLISMRRKFAAAVLCCAVTSLSACDVKNPIEGVTVRLNFAATETMAAMEFVDAATGQLITDTDVTVRFSGAASGRIVDLAGESLPEITVDQGLVAFGLSGNSVPTAESPVELAAHITAPGFLETTEDVFLSAAENSPVTVRLVRISAPPEGTAATVDNSGQASASGELTSTVAIATPAEPVTGGRTQVSMPAGTVIRDASGTPLTGTLSTAVVHFNSITDEALAAFPGGFDARIENPPADAEEEVSFVTAGFAAVTVTDQAGREAQNFSQPLSITIDVASETINPETGETVKAGDIVPYWSFEPSTGAWRYEGDVSLTGPDANGNFKGSFTTTHLSYFNLDWYGPRCYRTNVTVNGNPGGARIQYRLYRFGSLVRMWTDGDPVSYLYNAPTGPAVIRAFNPATQAEIGSTSVSNLCAGATITVTPPPSVTIELNLRATCPSNLELRPSGYVYIYDRSQGWFRYVSGTWIRNGMGRVSGLEPNKTYTVRGWGIYRGRYYSGMREFTTGAAGTEVIDVNYALDASVCS